MLLSDAEKTKKMETSVKLHCLTSKRLVSTSEVRKRVSETIYRIQAPGGFCIDEWEAWEGEDEDKLARTIFEEWIVSSSFLSNEHLNRTSLFTHREHLFSKR